MTDNGNHDIDLDKIIHESVAKANLAVDRHDDSLSFRMRILIAFTTIMVVASSVIGIYNSIALRQELKCNHELTNALNILADQSRDITKQAIDAALSGQNPKTHKPLTQKDLFEIKKQYDEGFKVNTVKRKALLANTCHDGSTPSPGS